MKWKSLLFFLFLLSIQTSAQISGCTDSEAKNYNPNAVINDGSCLYKKIKLKPVYSVSISDSIRETSGLLFWENRFWSMNDDTDTHLHSFDVNGKSLKKQVLPKVKNKDWEALAQDTTHIYIGDFGNNANGNRKDLHILKIQKKALLEGNSIIDTIFFSYENQTEFDKQISNTTNFDCEAFIATQDSLYLFSKEWSSQESRLYVLPKEPGTHLAKLKGALNVNGLVTDAVIVKHKNTVVLSGYTKKLKPFLYLLYDFKDNDYFSGNKRRIKLNLPFHQIEGITTVDGLNYFLTNEHFQRKPIITVQPQLHLINLTPFLNSHVSKNKK